MSESEQPTINYGFTLRKLAKCLYIYLGQTPNCGLGVFAAKSYHHGESIIHDNDTDYYDNAITFQRLVDLGYDINRCDQIGPDLYNPPNGNLDDFINHSCSPNIGFRITHEGYLILAIRDIAAGDELTMDYSTYISGTRETLHCRCSAPKCRRIIGAFADLPEALKRRYLEWDVVGDFARPSSEPYPAAD